MISQIMCPSCGQNHPIIFDPRLRTHMEYRCPITKEVIDIEVVMTARVRATFSSDEIDLAERTAQEERAIWEETEEMKDE